MIFVGSNSGWVGKSLKILVHIMKKLKKYGLSFVKTFRVKLILVGNGLTEKKTRRSKTRFKLSALMGDGILGEWIAKRY